jgi:hypothetical protein
MKQILIDISNWVALIVLVFVGLIVSGVVLRFLWNFFQFGWNLLG